MKWNPSEYLKYENERSLPCMDLLSRISLNNPKHIVDLGCGPGNSTELLFNRYPEALICGVDNSKEMLNAAKKRLPAFEFIQADLSTWRPSKSVNLLFANAVFQWIPNHLDVIKQMLNNLQPGSVLALQIPDNLNEPSHALMRQIASEDVWKVYFQEPINRERILSPEAYYNALKPYCKNLAFWNTSYRHVLDDASKIVEMIKSTGLSPYLQKLPKEKQENFLLDYSRGVSKAYPSLYDGSVLFSFPRFFMIATH